MFGCLPSAASAILVKTSSEWWILWYSFSLWFQFCDVFWAPCPLLIQKPSRLSSFASLSLIHIFASSTLFASIKNILFDSDFPLSYLKWWIIIDLWKSDFRCNDSGKWKTARQFQSEGYFCVWMKPCLFFSTRKFEH